MSADEPGSTRDTDADINADINADTNDELTVEFDGKQYTVEENVDFDGDGHNDTSVMATEDGGMIAVADTDKDGVADVAVEYDADGNPVAGAEFDPGTGVWTREPVAELPTPSGDGADDRDEDSGSGSLRCELTQEP
jgi:hypothetical protein